MFISDQLKQAIRDSGLSVNEIAARIGISPGVLYRFLSDDPAQHRDIRLETTADKVAKFLGMTLQPVDTPKHRPSAPSRRRRS